jgi:hypothetical protein
VASSSTPTSPTAPTEPAARAAAGKGAPAAAAPTRAEATTPAAPTSPTATTGAERGTVVVSGDATEVWLDGASGRFRPGSVPAGSYRIEARFGGELVKAGSVTVAAGAKVTVVCQGEFQLCKAR